MPLIHLDAARLCDWDSFHSVFASTFGFPNFYGRNMDAWIDCMTDLSEDTGMTTIHGSPTDPVILHLDNAYAVPTDIFDALVQCAAFVNWRRIQAGEPPVLMLAFYRSR